jgi:Thiolase-like protein type 1 additional C-terminal domain
VGIYSSEPPGSSDAEPDSHPGADPDPPDRESTRPDGLDTGRAHTNGDGTTSRRVLELDSVAPASGRITAWTVPYDRDGSPEEGIVLADTTSGHRTLARADDQLTAYLIAADHDVVGETVTFRREKERNLATAG